MIFTIRNILIIIFLYGCSTTNDYKEVFINVFSFKLNNIEYKPPLDAMPYNESPSLRVNINNEISNFYHFKKVDSRKYWKSNSDEILITREGKIIKSIGFVNNFELSNSYTLDNIINKIINENLDSFEHLSYVRYFNPETEFLPIKIIYRINDKLSDEEYFCFRRN